MDTLESNQLTYLEFCDFVQMTCEKLNSEARLNPDYFLDKDGQKLELEVLRVMTELSFGTKYQDKIHHLGGKNFPDIALCDEYGVEVKSTKQNHWTTLGNSVLESTRTGSVKYVFIIFGKLTVPVEFKARKYEDCLSEVLVTHYPRYKIDMGLENGQTIFEKMNISYDSLRSIDNPVLPLVDYYKSRLNEGESLWWVDNGTPSVQASPIVMKFWGKLKTSEKRRLKVEGMILFPEIFGSDQHLKYSRFSQWIASKYGIISNSLRDTFSAGGKCYEIIDGERFDNIPRAIYQILVEKDLIIEMLSSISDVDIEECWHGKYEKDKRLDVWKSKVVSISKSTFSPISDFLNIIFR